MDRRRATLAFSLAAAVLVVALSASSVSAVDKALCEEARTTLPNDPAVQRFKQCATAKAITKECCEGLAPLAKYYECLEDPTYKSEVGSYLGGVSPDDAEAKCRKLLGM